MWCERRSRNFAMSLLPTIEEASPASTLGAKQGALRAAAAFAIYLALSIAFFGRGLAGHLTDHYFGRDTDPSLYIWALAYWPHVLARGVNPFHTGLVWAPVGVNVAAITSMPLISILAAPITKTIGPLATYNLVSIRLPALAAFSALLTCNCVVR